MTARHSGDDDAHHPQAEVREMLSRLEALNRPEEIPLRINLLERVLTLLPGAEFSVLRAELHTELGDTFQRNRRGDRRAQLRRSVACYDTALTMHTREGTPTDWARIQHSRGIALHELAGLLTGSEREQMLRDAIACFEEIVSTGGPHLTPAIRASAQNNRAAFLRELAGLHKGPEQVKLLQEALAWFSEILREENRESAPAAWAAAQSNKGATLRDLAGLLADPDRRVEMVRAATACYDAALSIYTREGASADWAATQNNRGEALSYLSRLVSGEKGREALRAALACYDAALTVSTREERSANWTIVHNNKGIALFNLSRLLVGAERAEKLQAAIACFNAVLLERQLEEVPIDRARVQHNKGKALCDLAAVLIDTERAKALQEALTCFDEALLGRDSEAAPGEWAETQNNKGIALRDLAGLLRGAGRAGALRAAIACFDAVLLKRSRVEAPTDWAMAQNNKSAALRDLAATLGLIGTEQAKTLRMKILRAAIACCDEALSVYTREEAPSNWSAVQNNEGNALRELAEMLTGAEQKAALLAALACYNAALLEQSREENPISWAMMQNNKGTTLRDLARSSEGIERSEKLQEVMDCYDAVLSVYTRQVLPADHHRIAQSAGMLLFKEGDWENAARYLATALDALDDLFALEITARGRKAVLRAGGDLTAHLAYALLRTGAADAVRPAAEALERGRARATGEALTRQQAQLAAAERLAPELLERFREASHRLVKIALGDKTPEAAHAPERMSVVGEAAEPTALTALSIQLAGYQEAREARQVYDAVVERVREMIPDFLERSQVLEGAVGELAPDERLVYVASTPAGAAALLWNGPLNNPEITVAERWWDERLTSEVVARLLIGASAGGKHPGESPGLLAAQSNSRRLRRSLQAAMQTLGTPDGIFAHLASYCRAAGVRRLVLIPCGLLGLLPLHAALVPATPGGEETAPLIDVVQVSYAPSARIWSAGRRHRSGSHAGQVEALIVGDPQPQSEGTPPLPGARDEAQAIGALISHAAQGHASTFIGTEATLSATLEMLQGRNAALTHVHFACHGLAELADPQTSGLLLANGARLTTRDLLDPAIALFAQLHLVVLSACRTALVGTELPDEVVGLPSAWLQAGAKNVLASLWPVSDSVTVEFMKKFYELHLLDHLDPTEALWLAQRWLRGLQNPHHWAAFAMYGA